MIQNLFKLTLLLVTGALLVGCEADEADLLLQAETCINEKSGTGNIGECDGILSSLSTPRANTLKCKIKLEMSGLDNNRVTSALDSIQNSSSDVKEAEFMALVSLNSLQEANDTVAVCTDTESSGLEFIALSARMGTYFADQIDRLGDISEGNGITAEEASDMLVGCEADVGCQAAIGTAATGMYDTYCVNANVTDSDVCDDVLEAITSEGDNADPEDIGLALIALLDPNTP